MKDTLKILQDLQVRAFEKGIHSFQINARGFADEESFSTGLIVVVFLTDRDVDEDYGAFYFYSDAKPIDNYRALNNLKHFIGEE